MSTGRTVTVSGIGATGARAARQLATSDEFDTVVLAEAGGRFTTIDGADSFGDDPAACSGVATNGEGHDEFLALLRG